MRRKGDGIRANDLVATEDGGRLVREVHIYSESESQMSSDCVRRKKKWPGRRAVLGRHKLESSGVFLGIGNFPRLHDVIEKSMDDSLKTLCST